MKTKLLLIAFLAFTFFSMSHITYAQEVISGKIQDSNGEALIGATVKIKDQSVGTITDIDGNFKLNAAQGSVLVVSFIGFLTQEIKVDNKVFYSITLNEDIEALGEVVVVGYGTVQKSDLTGAVGKLLADETDKLPVSSVDQLMQGRMTGVQITQSSGAPGAGLNFLIRGTSTFGGTQPLVILDGYPIDPDAGSSSEGIADDTPASNPLANLNPNEIESIEVLKDASSQAIYGSRAANGVVIITTKAGRKGESKFDISYRTDVSQIRKKLDVLSTQQFIEYRNEAALADGMDSVFTAEQILAIGDTSTNWQDEIYDVAFSHNIQFGVSGGSDNSTYRVTAHFIKNNGIIKNSDFTRGGLRVNYRQDVNDWLNFGVNMAATKTHSNLGLHSNNNGIVSSNVVSSILFFRPFDSPFNDFGELDEDITNNPFILIENVDDVQDNTFLVSNLKLNAKLAKGLFFRINAGANSNIGTRSRYMPRGTFRGDQVEGYAFRGQTSNFNYLAEYTVDYRKKFGKNSIDAVVGYTYQKWDRRFLATSATGFLNDNLGFENLQSANTPGITTTRHQEWALASLLYRFNYSFQNKYIFTATGRNDGSTRLQGSNKWTFYPSFALGWKVHNEEFMTGQSLIETLKLRASWGQSGNQNVRVGGTQQFLDTDRVVVGSGVVNGYIKGALANPELGWERTSQWNLGFDAGFLNNRLQFEANFYRKETKDLILNLPIPSIPGVNTMNTNSGTLQNEGMEFDLRAVIANKNDFSWSAIGNISFNRNEMLSLGELPDSSIVTGSNYLAAGLVLNQPLHVATVGQPVGSFYGYVVEGIYQSQEEIDGHLNASGAAGLQPGDFRFADLNGDSVITADDRKIIGNPNPDFVFGFTNEFRYKQFSLSVFVQGVIGNDVINLNRYRLDALTGNNHNVSLEAYENRWTEENPGNVYPRLSNSGQYFANRFPDFIVEDGSFVRLKNITLSYTFNKLPKAIDNLTVFVTGTNLLTWTNYSGYDPEVSANTSGLEPGVDNGTYPQLITLSGGVNFTF